MDYKLIYDEEKQACDISLETINNNQIVDVQDGGDLINAVLISLLSERAAESDWTTTLDKRGWWGDADNERQLGSRLWQLEYLPVDDSSVYLGTAEGYVIEALTWLVDDRICKNVSCSASFVDQAERHLNLDITLTKADNQEIRYSYVWDGALT